MKIKTINIVTSPPLVTISILKISIYLVACAFLAHPLHAIRIRTLPKKR